MTRASAVFVFVAALFGTAFMAAASVYAEPSSTEATSVTPSPGTPVPTPHSYDDEHSGQQPQGASPALWILAGAVIGLVSIAVILLRAGRPASHGSTRSP